MKLEVFLHSDLSHAFTMFNMNTVTVYSYSVTVNSYTVILLYTDTRHTPFASSVGKKTDWQVVLRHLTDGSKY